MSRTRPTFQTKMKVLDLVRHIGQQGIDSAKLTLTELTKKAISHCGCELPQQTVQLVMKTAGLKPYPSSHPTVGIGSVHKRISELTERLDKLEATCKAHGIDL